MADILLDTTFLLPTLGFEVREIEKNELQTLRAALNSGIRFFCSYVSFVEIFGKLARNPGKGDFPQHSVEEGIRSLLESRTYEWVNPSAEALNKAFTLRLRGHKDNIDNTLFDRCDF